MDWAISFSKYWSETTIQVICGPLEDRNWANEAQKQTNSPHKQIHQVWNELSDFVVPYIINVELHQYSRIPL